MRSFLVLETNKFYGNPNKSNNNSNGLAKLDIGRQKKIV